MIKITIPEPNVVIKKGKQVGEPGEPALSTEYGFTNYMKVARDKGGIFMFFDVHDQLLYVGKARKLRQRIRKNFEDTVSPIKNHRDEVYKIAVCYIEDPVERDIYETYIINKLQAKYNIDKVFFK
ncbi:nucleotide excision repair endonuclease [Bacillus sp. FJAT-52991]|uniref:Nucleotide excision repair endonuclease n=1 Tax=Bacillus kandeliae TaxID=3129297 RepID=A0ABZ2N962_9BACI